MCRHYANPCGKIFAGFGSLQLLSSFPWQHYLPRFIGYTLSPVFSVVKPKKTKAPLVRCGKDTHIRAGKKQVPYGFFAGSGLVGRL